MQPTDRNNLAAPLNNRLYFAGEHTSANYPATVHGAYLSGLAAASAVLSATAPAPTSTGLSTKIFVTQTVNTGQTLAQMQAPAFATAFANGMQAALPGTTITVTGVAASTRRFLLAAAAVSYTATSATLSVASLKAGISSTAATTAVTSSLQTAGFSGITLAAPTFATPTPAPTSVSDAPRLSQVRPSPALPPKKVPY